MGGFYLQSHKTSSVSQVRFPDLLLFVKFRTNSQTESKCTFDSHEKRESVQCIDQ